ncbi:Hypothetical predicted protein [Cloeon dipterum]|uniref:Lipid-binding serum glycoprotein N-terminal domain-containing protein n=1 Tax=Cloeon dipterum TaxID=197152 RepID=A0A8S1DTB8_9INSE|nr:Hypothetical predicted protein [Cloeon dipterum]
MSTRLALVFFLLFVAKAENELPADADDTNYQDLQEDRVRRPGYPTCAARLAPALKNMRRKMDEPTGKIIDLKGLTLHQSIQGAPLDMYITDMKVKGLGQHYLQRCSFARSNHSLMTNLVFNEIMARGTVRLRDTSPLGVLTWLVDNVKCDITLRMRAAPLEVAVSGDAYRRGVGPQVQPTSRMSSRFLPEANERTEFKGCDEPLSHRRRSDDGAEDSAEARTRQYLRTPAIVRQMETGFMRGIRQIMGMYMERQLRTTMTDTLMAYMGYTVSYG